MQTANYIFINVFLLYFYVKLIFLARKGKYQFKQNKNLCPLSGAMPLVLYVQLQYIGTSYGYKTKVPAIGFYKAVGILIWVQNSDRNTQNYNFLTKLIFPYSISQELLTM